MLKPRVMLTSIRLALACLVLTLIAALVVPGLAAADSSAELGNQPANQWAIAAYDRPAYNCRANDGKSRVTYGDLGELQFCWNSSIHLRVSGGWPTVIGGNVDRHSVRRYTDLNDTYDIYQDSDRSGKWDFTILPRPTADKQLGYWFDFRFNAKAGAPILDSYVFYRVNGGKWTSDPNGDSVIPLGSETEIVLVAVNNLLPLDTRAPIPFNQDDVFVF